MQIAKYFKNCQFDAEFDVALVVLFSIIAALPSKTRGPFET